MGKEIIGVVQDRLLKIEIEETLKHLENTVNSFDPRKKPNSNYWKTGLLK